MRRFGVGLAALLSAYGSNAIARSSIGGSIVVGCVVLALLRQQSGVPTQAAPVLVLRHPTAVAVGIAVLCFASPIGSLMVGSLVAWLLLPWSSRKLVQQQYTSVVRSTLARSPSLAPAHCYISEASWKTQSSSAQTIEVVAGEPQWFVVQALKSNLQPHTDNESGWDVRVTASGNAPPVVAQLLHDSHGRYRCELLLRKAMTYSIAITLNGVHIRYDSIDGSIDACID